MAIGSESGSISSQNLEQLRTKVEQTKSTLETEDPDLIATLDREDLLGDLFHAGMLGYYAQYTALGSLMGLQTDGQMMLQAGMGLQGYEPKVNTLFGFPISISPGGVVFDIPIARSLVIDGLDPEANAQFSQQIGLLSSALEHATPEQMFSTEEQPADAISAVKALSKANAQGQRIYELTRDNLSDTLPNLNLASETEDEIRRAARAGLTVIAHTDPVEVPGWRGAGYIIFNPDTGGGAYKISGGVNGGFGDPGGESAAGFLFLGITGAAVPAILLLILAIFAIYQAILALIEITTILSDSGCPVELLIVFGAIIVLFAAIGLFFSTFGAVIMLLIGSFLAEQLARSLVDAISRIDLFCPAVRNS